MDNFPFFIKFYKNRKNKHQFQHLLYQIPLIQNIPHFLKSSFILIFTKKKKIIPSNHGLLTKIGDATT